MHEKHSVVLKHVVPDGFYTGISPFSLTFLESILPSATSHLVLCPHAADRDTDHGFTQTLAALGQDLGVPEVSRGPHDGLCPLGRVSGLEDAATDEHAVAAQLHHQRGVGGSGDTSGGKVDDGQSAQLGSLLQQLRVALEFSGQLTDGQVAAFRQCSLGPGNVLADLAHVLDGLDNVAGAGLALGPDHGGALGDAAQGLGEVPAAADKGGLEAVLLDVVLVVGGGQDLALVNVVDAERLEDLALDEVADAGLGHDGDGDGVLDLLDLARVRHADDAALAPDVGRHALQRHDGAGPGLLGDAGLLGVGHVHDDAALEHLRQARLDLEVVGRAAAVAAVAAARHGGGAAGDVVGHGEGDGR